MSQIERTQGQSQRKPIKTAFFISIPLHLNSLFFKKEKKEKQEWKEFVCVCTHTYTYMHTHVCALCAYVHVCICIYVFVHASHYSFYSISKNFNQMKYYFNLGSAL